MAKFLQRERIVAPPGWSRWLVPPAALSIHLAIGQAYAWSVFKPPLEKGLGISGVASALPFTLGIIMLGLSAALFGTRVDSQRAAVGDGRVVVVLRQRLPDLRARRSTCGSTGWSSSATASSAGSGWASATSRRSPR